MKDLVNLIKPYLAPKLLGWLLKVMAGVFLALGWSETQATAWLSPTIEMAFSAVSLGLGILISMIQNKKAIMAEPPKVDVPK